MIKALLWDVDGVLVDTEELHFKSWQWMVEEAGGKPLTIEEYVPCVGHSGWENVERLAKLKGITGDLERLRLLRRQKFEELREAGVPVISENVNLVREFKKDYPELRQIVVSSASRADIKRNLSNAGLTDFFESIVSYEETENMPRKPAPDIYLYALNKSGLSAQECAAFEDTESGITSATSAGIMAIALPNRLTDAQDFSKAKLIIKQSEPKNAKDIISNLTK